MPLGVLLSDWCACFGVDLQAAGAGCRLRVLVPLHGAASGCCLCALDGLQGLSERCARFGEVPLQGAAERYCCQSAELGCCAAVKALLALWSLVAGAAAGCRCKVLLSESCLRFGLWSLVAAGCCCKNPLCCCQRAVCALELACWCRCRVPLQGSAALECCPRFFCYPGFLLA